MCLDIEEKIVQGLRLGRAILLEQVFQRDDNIGIRDGREVRRFRNV
jgi:hypothetical protein